VFAWMDRKKYRSEVLAHLQAVLFDPSTAFLRTLKSTYPGFDKAIDDGFVEKRSKEALAVNLAGAVLSNAIEQISDAGRRNRMVQEIRAWASEPDSIARFRADARRAGIPPDVDAFQWKLQWAVIYVSGLHDQNLIDRQTESWFNGEVFGALAGKSAQQRESERLSTVIRESLNLLVLREGDDGPLLPPDLGSSELPVLCGIEIKVRLVPTATGIILVNEDDGQQVTEQRALTQDDLSKIPLDADGYTFVNFQPPSDDLSSCIITKPDTVVYGSMRAFWWSLAKSNVITTDAKASGTRMTRTAFARVFGEARAMWDIAIKEAGSIDRMRDMIVPLRNVHLTVISQMKEKETSEAAKLGLDIALAMVLATQSEDPKLEAFACRRFKRFLWQPGEEPMEFRQFATG
jgi:hypothetical protein